MKYTWKYLSSKKEHKVKLKVNLKHSSYLKKNEIVFPFLITLVFELLIKKDF